ncbi:MAG: protoporphyrinogen oxidase, partial [Planctomycetota bacterium]|nr:protoporphyrinogen oxidase [Planctomycetota bacterium]
MKRVVIIGGGISGLSVAYALQGKAQVTLLEANALGGVIQTDRTGLYIVEGGPDSFVTARPAALDLCREIGLESELIPMSLRKLYVRSGGVFHEMPPGFFLTVPTKIRSVLKSGLFSWKGKLRMGMEYFRPRGGDEEESIGSFVRRRFGQEMVDKVADPLMGGIYSGPADQISLRATFPQFQKMEREHRSLIRAMRKTKMPEGNPLMSLRGGMATLVERLLEKIDIEIIKSRVLRVEGDKRVVHEAGSLEADEVVVATPAPAAAGILQNWPDL